ETKPTEAAVAATATNDMTKVEEKDEPATVRVKAEERPAENKIEAAKVDAKPVEPKAESAKPDDSAKAVGPDAKKDQARLADASMPVVTQREPPTRAG